MPSHVRSPLKVGHSINHRDYLLKILKILFWCLHWLLPNFRSPIKLNLRTNIPSANIPPSGLEASNTSPINTSINGQVPKAQINLINQGTIPPNQLLDTSDNVFQSYQYQYQVTLEHPLVHTAARPHLVTVQLYYGTSNGDLLSKLQLEFNQKNLAILPKQNRYGWYGLWHHKQNAYLTSCINVRGGTTVNQGQFMANRNQYDLSLDRLPAYIMGRTHWRDYRCIWVVMQTPITTATQLPMGSLPRLFARNMHPENEQENEQNDIENRNGNDVSDTYDNPEFVALEALWQVIYPHWQSQMPPYKS